MSRMTIVTSGSGTSSSRINKQLNKLVEIVKGGGSFGSRAHRARADADQGARRAKEREDMKRMADIFRGPRDRRFGQHLHHRAHRHGTKLDAFIQALDQARSSRRCAPAPRNRPRQPHPAGLASGAHRAPAILQLTREKHEGLLRQGRRPVPRQGKKVTILGYGSQGHAHALNLHDSGQVTVGCARGARPGQAKKAGLKVAEIAEASRARTSS